MELNGIVQSLEHKSILVTGSTGFLSKIFVEKLLRVQPNVKQLFLLLRTPDAASATQRLHIDVTGKEVFKVLRTQYGDGFDSFISEKVTPVAGDISLKNFGIKDSILKKKMQEEVDIVANFAATTTFDERYDVALDTNTLGPKHVLDFAENCENLEMLLHISTAYVCRKKSGVILEEPFNIGEATNDGISQGLDIEAEMMLVNERLNELKAAQVSKNEETYAMKELGNQRGIDPIIVSCGRGKLSCFLGNPETILDVIPGDMVVNAIIVAMVLGHANYNSINGTDVEPNYIYHVGSSGTIKDTMSFLRVVNYSYQYFSKNPWTGKDGKLVPVGAKPFAFPTMADFQRHIHINYVLPTKARKISYTKLLVELYEHYFLLNVVFDDSEMKKLRRMMMMRANKAEADAFHFDPKSIDWEDYFMNIHIPGLLKYVIKLEAPK